MLYATLFDCIQFYFLYRFGSDVSGCRDFPCSSMQVTRELVTSRRASLCLNIVSHLVKMRMF